MISLLFLLLLLRLLRKIFKKKKIEFWFYYYLIETIECLSNSNLTQTYLKFNWNLSQIFVQFVLRRIFFSKIIFGRSIPEVKILSVA